MNVTIPRREYLELQDAYDKLQLLESAGLDNWRYYDEALEGYRPTSELYQEAEDILNELTEGSQVDYPAGRDAGHRIIFSESAVERIVEMLKEKKQ